MEQLWPGRAFPLGAHYDGEGTNFSIVSTVATRVDLCLFDTAGVEKRITLLEVTGNVWHGYLPGVGPGQQYGYRVHGPFEPSAGIRCHPAKLLIDPYALAIEGQVDWHASLYDSDPGDSAKHMPRCIVVDESFEWGGETPLGTPWHETVIYELHTKGFSALNPQVPEELRGTFAGLAHPASTKYLSDLGITAIELMPVHHFIHDQRLVSMGLRNYWGYNTIGFFAPHGEYAQPKGPGSQVRSFKEMVKAMHSAGIEVILDVVFNHTAEAGKEGPTLSFRGIDNEMYYRLAANDKQRYVDYTGCGNTMNMQQPFVLQLMMDSLRYWVEEMHVDGFRFDLASALARDHTEVDRLSAFFSLIQQDPVLRRVKRIAEPWDLFEGGYQVGNCPAGWSEWNGKYRDTSRDYWRGTDQTLAEFACRFTGSSDLYESSSRRPHASINFVTCHDGFTMRDLVSYNEKHNADNGEQGRDGESHNRSWNCGQEGETSNRKILSLRHRQQRNLFASLLLSQGVPMLLAGDELGRTQGGNNNPYCQDNEISWVDWSADHTGLHDFVRGLLRLRAAHPVFRRRRWFQGRLAKKVAQRDIAWFRPDGSEMSTEDWSVSFAKSMGIFLNGDAIASKDVQGERIVDDSFYVLLNASDESLRFTLPPELTSRTWHWVVDTKTAQVGGANPVEETTISMEAHSVGVWQRQRV